MEYSPILVPVVALVASAKTICSIAVETLPQLAAS